MTCSKCKEGQPCVTCEMKEMGFVTAADMDKAFKERESKKGDAGGVAQQPRYTVDEILAHFDDGTCTGGNCPVHRQKTALIEEGAAQGVEAGIKLGKLA